MSDLKKRLDEWNEGIDELQKLRSKVSAKVMRMRDGYSRRFLIRLLNFIDRWIARGKRWRAADMEE